MRLGAQETHMVAGTKAREVYGKDVIVERHRHRFEVNNQLVGKLREAGLTISGWSFDDTLVEVIEYEDHPWFVATQFHPEFTSRPRTGHPLFKSFVEASIKNK